MSITLPHCDSSHCSYGGDEFHSTPLWLQPLQLWGWWVSLHPTVTPATSPQWGWLVSLYPTVTPGTSSQWGWWVSLYPTVIPATAAMGVMSITLPHCDSSHCSYGGDEYHSTPLWLQPLQLWGWWVSLYPTVTPATAAMGVMSITPPHCDSSHCSYGGDEYHSTPLWLQPLQLWGWWVSLYPTVTPATAARGVMSFTLPHCDSSHCSYGGDEYHSTPLWLQPLQLWGWWVSLYPTVTPATAAMGVMSFTLPHCDSSHCSYGGDEYHSTPLWFQPLQLWGWWVSLYPTVTPATAAMGVMSITLPHCDSSHCSYGGDEYHSTPLWLQPLQLWGWWVSLYPTVTPATAAMGVMSFTLPHCDSSHCSYGGDEFHSTPLWLQPLQLWGWWVSLYPTVTPATAAMGVMSITLPHCDSSHCSYGGDEYHSTPLWLQPLQLWGWWVSLYPTVTPATAAMGVMSFTLPHCDSSHCSYGGDEFHSTPLWLQPLQLWGWWVSLHPTVTPATAAMGVMSITLPHCDSSHCSYGGDEFHSTPLWLQPLQLWGWWVSLYPTVTPATAAMGVMSFTLTHCDSSHCSYGGDEFHSTPLWLQPLQLWGWWVSLHPTVTPATAAMGVMSITLPHCDSSHCSYGGDEYHYPTVTPATAAMGVMSFTLPHCDSSHCS